MEVSAPVFDIQTMCIHDGPGIRTTVFVKGCPLNCLWCANPESKKAYPQLMSYKSKCTGCGACVDRCSNEAITIGISDGKALAVTDRSKCTNCGQCLSICLNDAREIIGEETTVAAALKEVLKDKIFYDGSGGGMTISGGEPLIHPDFCCELLSACRQKGVHTAIETSVFAETDVIDRVFEYVDLGLLDIKHMDSDIHKKLTGVPNEKILENIQHIYHDLKVPVIIRVPVIPGFNNETGNICAIADFTVTKLGQDVSVHLMPYHRLGESKNESLGKDMDLSVEIPDQVYMEGLKMLVESYGLKAQIGG